MQVLAANQFAKQMHWILWLY